MRLFRTVAVLVLAAVPLAAQGTKDVADSLMSDLRRLQNEDGTYGADLIETCRVLDLLARSPRRYSELDGPFFRKAARAVARAPADPSRDAWVALALASAVTGELAGAREAALERIRAHEGVDDYARALALRSFPDAGRALRAPDTADDAGLACLLAEDPTLVTPPPVDDQAAWNRWARAARLRGIRPAALPELPRPGPRADLGSLLADLETTILMHGLHEQPATLASAHWAVPPRVGPNQDLTTARRRAWNYLENRQQDGTFGMELPGWEGPEPGITALCLTATIQLARDLDRPRPDWVDQGLDYLVALQHSDGSIQEHGLAVYTTSVATEALLTAGREADRPVIDAARDFLIAVQSDEGEGYRSDEDWYYGGVGYGGDQRPDLSNTQYAVEMVARAGTPSDHEFFEKARIYLERCQNHGEMDAGHWPRAEGGHLVKGVDGGATYMPGDSKAGEDQVGEGLYQARSYGSMTYALVKSYLFAGLPADDPRVQAAVGWIAAHFTVEQNPGFKRPEQGAQGLYYYYLAMSRSLRLLPPDLGVRDEDGRPIDWRSTLRKKLLSEQRVDGSWLNEGSERWWEGAPTLCTAYAVLTLSAAEDTP
ncbi:MAG: prenyltransferase/squalene oxidase repeat-containing protein [Planctomycetota bacterium]